MSKINTQTVTMADHELTLLPSGAIYCAALDTLFVADVHLGKAATYRRLGQPVPAGTTSQTLAQLSRDILHHRVGHLIVLGDFLHGPHVQRSASTLQTIDRWRHAHAQCAMTLIRGNHDDRAGDPPQTWDINVVDEPYVFEGMACCHDRHGVQSNEDLPVLWGHAHPVALLRGRARERFRLPCFVVGDRHLLLPAYGAFTGGHVYETAPDDVLYVIAQQSVFKLPGSAAVGCQGPSGRDQ